MFLMICLTIVMSSCDMKLHIAEYSCSINLMRIPTEKKLEPRSSTMFWCPGKLRFFNELKKSKKSKREMVYHGLSDVPVSDMFCELFGLLVLVNLFSLDPPGFVGG